MTDEDSPALGSVKSTFKNIMTTVMSSTDWECLFHYWRAAETKAFAAASGASFS
jgi:hypothetical protein